jgi:hypothetical protein
MISALSQTSTLAVGDSATQVTYGGTSVPGPLYFIDGCEVGTCGGGSSSVSTTPIAALTQITAIFGRPPQNTFTLNAQSGLYSLDLSGLGGTSYASLTEEQNGSGVGTSAGFGSGNPSNTPGGQAAAGPRLPQVTVLLPGKLISLPPRPPVDQGVPGLNGENSSLGNSGLW